MTHSLQPPKVPSLGMSHHAQLLCPFSSRLGWCLAMTPALVVLSLVFVLRDKLSTAPNMLPGVPHMPMMLGTWSLNMIVLNFLN